MQLPLISGYKSSFIIRRLLQTLLGGPRIVLPFRTTFLAILIQAILFGFPWAVSRILSIFIDSGEMSINTAMYIFACLMGATVFVLHVINYILQRETKVVSMVTKSNHLHEEDEVELSKFCGVETFKFIFQARSNWPSIILYSLISAFMCAISLNYLRSYTLSKWWNSQAVVAAINGFGWLTVCITHYSLIAMNPPEPAIFGNNGNSFLGTTFRPFYTCCLLGIHCITWKYESWKEVDGYLHIVFILLPVLWMLGILPPQDALLLWAGEQILCLLFGGSASASGSWLLFTLSLSASLAFFIHYLQNWMMISIISSCAGYLLSINLEPWIIHFTKVALSCMCCKKFISHIGFIRQTKLPHTTRKHFFLHFGMIVVAGILAWSPNSSDMNSLQHSILWTASGYLTITLLLTLWLYEQLQRIYMFRGTIRNCFYDATRMSSPEFNKKRSKIVCCNIRIILQILMPLIMVFILSAFGNLSHNEISLLSSVSAVRAFRQVWQHTENSYLDMSMVYIVSESATLSPEHSLPLTVRLLIAGVVRHRLTDALKKLYVIAVITVTSVSNKKQRQRYSWLILGLDVIFLPVLLAFAALSIVLCAPLLPLFTLPLFLVGFPRPIKFWPGPVDKSAGDSLDAVYYQQIIPTLTTGLQKALYVGSLGTICDGDYFLARFQDRLIWILVLERGFGYCKMSIKGLELQETSCHAVEALRVDEIFEQAFDKQDSKKRNWINRIACHTLIPCDAIAVKTYSDARNVLTGIIHSIETLNEIKEKFPKVLTWILVYSIVKNKEKSTNKSGIGSTEMFPKVDLTTETSTERCKITNSSEDFQNFETNSCEENVSSINETWADVHHSSVLSSWPDDDDPLDDNKSLFSHHVGTPREQVLKKHIEVTIPGALQDSGESKAKVDYINKHEILASHEYFSVSPFSLPKEWLLLLSKFSLYNKFSYFSKQWFYQVVLWMSKGVDDLKNKNDLLDEYLSEMYEKVVSFCYHALNLDEAVGPDRVHKVFIGVLPPSLMQEQLDKCRDLRQLVLTAYRYTVKLALDKYLIGPISSDDELNECLQDYSESWYIGVDEDEQWREAILNQCPYLFSIGFDEVKNVYTSHLLSLQEQPLYIGSLNSALVQSIWSSLCVELLYLTNDDEERYSIQAEPTILRNLTVQAADPPLGYPVYSSKSITLSTLIL